MSEEHLDAQGEAREALNSAVANFGQRILSDPRMLANVVTDLLPDLPRERNLLVTGAEAEVAAELRQHVEEQHVSPATAVQLVARALTERRAINQAASMWVAAEYAQALGYPVRSDAQPTAPHLGTVPPEAVTAAPTVTAAAAQGLPPAQNSTGMPRGDSGGHPPQELTGGQPQGPGQPAAPAAARDVPHRRRRNRGLIIAAASVAGVVVVYLIVAGAARIVPFAPGPKPPHPKHHPQPTVIPLVQLLPNDVDDPATQCKNFKPPFNAPGMTQDLSCNDPGLPNGLIEAYQMKSYANYEASWVSFNSWWGFDSGTPGSSCPPASNSTQAEGTTTWHDSNFSTRVGQVVECEWTDNNSVLDDPAYAWTYPSENAFIIAWAAPKSTFATLNHWFDSISESIYSASPSASS